MKSIYIYHHLGMGDMILCNGLVRTLTAQYDKVYLFVLPMYLNNGNFMYRDNPKIKLIPMTKPLILSFISYNPQNTYKIVGNTKEWFNRFDTGEFGKFDRGFYIDAGIPHEYKWDKFHVDRDLLFEKNAFYNILGLTDNDKFIFVHDDILRNRFMDSKYFAQDTKIIKPCDFPNLSIFDFIYTIEMACEVHVHNSAFSCLIDTMQLRNDNIFYHEYTRTDMGPNPNHSFKLDWVIIK